MSTQTPTTTPSEVVVEKPKLAQTTLSSIRNLVKHKYRGDARKAFNDYADSDETPIATEAVTLMLVQSGVSKDKAPGEAKLLVKAFDADDDGSLTLAEFDRLITGL